MINNKKAYTASNIQAAYDKIRSNKEKLQMVCSYRIQVDGKSVVKRTYDLNEFYSYRHSLKPETKTVIVTIYGRFFPIETFELKRKELFVSNEKGYNPNEELAFENVRLFSEVLDKDVEIFELREQLARTQIKTETSAPKNISDITPLDIFKAVLSVLPKDKLSEALNSFEKQLNSSHKIVDEIRNLITPKK